MNYNIHICDNKIESIQSIPYFQSSIYHNLNISATLEFFIKRYVAPIGGFVNISDAVVVDCGAGHGWFSIAYLLAGGKAAIAVDVDEKRLDTAKEISKILSIDNKIEFILSPLHTIPLPMNYADFFVSIETLEHVGKEYISTSLHHMKEIASKGILFTTPNKYFPLIAHDTALPFAHWLPQELRIRYARIFGREHMDYSNQFLSPLDIKVLLDKFRPATSCLTFQSYSEFINHYPFYLPYGRDELNRMKLKPSVLKAAYYRFVSTLFGNDSYWVMPNMAHIFLRR